jgi:hypothetical protein
MAEYLILIYADENAWEGVSEEEKQAAYAEYGAFGERNASVIRGGSELAPTATATSIRRNGGDAPVITDGAFVETKEALGGYYLIEVDSLDDAIRVAKEVPCVSGGVEVRPLTGVGV